MVKLYNLQDLEKYTALLSVQVEKFLQELLVLCVMQELCAVKKFEVLYEEEEVEMALVWVYFVRLDSEI